MYVNHHPNKDTANIMATNNLPALATAQLPAFLAAAMQNRSTNQALLTGLSTAGSVLRLVANQGRFRIKDGGTETILPDLYLDTIIIGGVPGATRAFYATAYKPSDEKENKQPDCASLRGDVPDANSPNKQAVSCAACPQNVWGSKISPTGSEIKACSEYRRIALVAADDPDTLYQANIPPASISKSWTKYLKEMDLRGIDLAMVKTRISLQEHVWKFDYAGFINEEQLASIQRLLSSSAVDDILGLSATPAAAAPAAAAPAPAPAPAKPKMVPAAPPAPTPEPPAPARGFGKKNGAAAAAPVVQNVAVPSEAMSALTAELGNLIGGAADL